MQDKIYIYVIISMLIIIIVLSFLVYHLKLENDILIVLNDLIKNGSTDLVWK